MSIEGASAMPAVAPIAVLDKPDPRRDYEWSGGELPRAIHDLAEALVARALAVVAVIGENDHTWLVRSTMPGLDSAARPIVRVDIGRITDAAVLAPQAALKICESVGASWRAGGLPTTSTPPPAAHDVALPTEIALRARIGLPLATDTAMAGAITRRHPWRYRGICITRHGGSDLPRELVTCLGVNFLNPPLSPADAAMLQAARTRNEDEWKVLDAIPAADVQRALRWIADARPPRDLAIEDWENDPLVPWVASIYPSSVTAQVKLECIRRDYGPSALTGTLVRAVDPQLSPAAATLLASLARGEPAGAVDLALLDELAARGHLDSLPPSSMRIWLPVAMANPSLRPVALAALQRNGMNPHDARFIFDLLDEGEPPHPHDPYVVLTAVDHELPPPRRALLRWTATLGSPHELTLFREVTRLYGGWAADLAHLIDHGELPPGEDLPIDVIVTALGVRGRLNGDEWPLLELLQKLTRTGDEPRLHALLAATESIDSLWPSDAARALVRTHILRGAPVIINDEQIAPVVRFGLASPRDVTAPETADDLAAMAHLWNETEPLATILYGTAQSFTRPSYPSSWHASVRRAITPRVVERMALRLPAAERDGFWEWTGKLHGLDWTAFEDLANTSEQAMRPLLPWLRAFAAAKDPAWKLRTLAALAAARVAAGDDALARQLIGDLLPGADEPTSELAYHLLCGGASFPMLDGIAPHVITALAPCADARELLDALFRMRDTHITTDSHVLAAVRARVRETSPAPPQRAYTPAQRKRHAVLVAELADLPSWSLAGTAEERKELARILLRKLDVHPHDLCEAS